MRSPATRLVANNPIEPQRAGMATFFMLRWAVIFLVIAIIAAIFGFGGVAGASADIAKILFYLFIAIFVISLLFGLFRGRGGV